MSDQIAIESPTLQTLCEDLGKGDSEALEAFWGEIEGKHTPLIEPIEGRDTHSLVTFLWRAETPLHTVRIIGYIFGGQDNEMSLLPDSDVWYRSCKLANDVRATYQFMPMVDAKTPELAPAIGFDAYVQDPLNLKTYHFNKDEEDPDGFELTRSVVEMPKAPPQPLNDRHSDVPAGSVEMHRLRSVILENERRVWVYTPAGYDPKRSQPYDVLVLFDGTGFVLDSPLTTILDNLIAAGDIPPLVAIMPCSLSASLRFRELVLHEPFNKFLAKELMPWAREAYHLTTDPKRVVVSGASAGGLAAAYAGFASPELFGNVLSMSGAFVMAPGLFGPDWEGEHEWFAQQIAATETRPVRFWLSAGTLETTSNFNLKGGPRLLASNRHLRTILELKGYEHWLHEFPGAHDMISWQGVIPKGLRALLG